MDLEVIFTLLFTAITNMITNAISAMITVPTGTILSLAQATTPTGYLLCDGSAVSRTTYSNLFAAIGTTYGAGNGTTTFNLPDLRGVFIRGLDLSKGYDPSRAIGTYQVDGFGSHIHSITDPTHAHAPLAGSNFITSPGNWNGSTGSYGNYNGGTTTASASTGITINSTGISETRPKNVALYPVIKI
jgi:microcystin-dependent protein